MWSSVADAWAQHADFVDERAVAVTRHLLDRAGIEPGRRVLDLACGAGGAGLAAAERVGPTGEVVLSDLVPEMTAIAKARADARGLTNVRTRELDLIDIDQPDASYDAVLCREGLMFAGDTAKALHEVARVLRPGGRAAFAVWAERDRNPWLGTLLDAVSAQLGMSVPPPGIPGPFELSDPDVVASLLAGAGLLEVEVTEMACPQRLADFATWWTVVPSLAGPLAQILATQPADAVEAIRVRAAEALAPYETPDGLDIPGVTLVASARRPV